MKITVIRSLIFGIAILNSHIWIVPAEEIVKGINFRKDSARPKEEYEDETDSKTFLSTFISSSFITTANLSPSYIEGSAIFPSDKSASLLNIRIQHSSTDETYHQVVHSTTSNVPTSNLLNSLYLLESSHLLEDPFYLSHISNSHAHIESDSHVEFASSSIMPTSLPPLSSSSSSLSSTRQGIKFSFQVHLHPVDFILRPDSSPDTAREFSDDNLPLTSFEIPSPSNVFVYESITTSEIMQSNNGQISVSTYSEIQGDNLSNSYSILNEVPQFKEHQPTIALNEEMNTDYSNFFIETSIIPNNQAKSEPTEQMPDLERQTATVREFSTSKTEPVTISIFSSSETSPDTVFSSAINVSNNSHEIVDGTKGMNNKTFRNEDAEIDEIISGIVHLLAGNVQLVRPTKNGLGIYPTRLHIPPPPALVSTRINNRGPMKPNGYSRTVVVFSQPPNKGNPTELTLPGHIFPSNIQNPQFIRIRPTKVGDYPPTAMIQFYNQGVNRHHFPQTNRPFQPAKHQVPFRGEILNTNNRPNPNNRLNPNNVRIIVPSNEYVKPSFTNLEQQYSANGIPGNKYQHFIFSDNAASSVIVLQPSKPPLVETFLNTHPYRHKTESSTYKNPSQSFEVLIDDTMKKKVFVSEISPVSSSNFDVFNGELSSYTSLTSDSAVLATKIENIFPYGPVTDWVPFSERPSVRANETFSFVDDSNVSIIMHPVIFDVTVSNSVGEVGHSKNITLNEDSSVIPISDTEAHSTSLNNDSMDEESSSVLDRNYLNYLANVSKKFFNEHSQNDTNLISYDIIKDGSTPISKIENFITEITGAFSASTIDITPTYSIDLITKSLSIVQNFDLGSSYNQGNFYIENETATENTEIVEEQLPSPTIFSSISTTSNVINLSSMPNISDQSYISSISSTHSELSISKTPSVLTISSASSVPTVFSTSTIPKKSTSTTSTTEQKSIGIPIIIPVDIEHVRPFAGPIRPYQPGQNRENQNQRPFNRDQGNDIKNEQGKKSPLPHIPVLRGTHKKKPNIVRIDTCIVGDDSTCDITLNETCKREAGISSCNCRPGYARSTARGPCIPVVSLMLGLKVDRFGNQKLTFSVNYSNKDSEEYRIMEFESKAALSSLISKIPAFSRTFQGVKINNFYGIGNRVVINSTIFLEEKPSTKTQAVKLLLRQLIGTSIKNRRDNIGDSRLYVDSASSPVTAVEDINECSDANLNDCSPQSICFNIFGSYLCKCKNGYVDAFLHDERRSGRQCSSCTADYCSFHGKCYVEGDKKLCQCHGHYIGSKCDIDGEVLGVAVGASLAAIIIILLTLLCLCLLNRKWKQKQQKAEHLSSRSYTSNQAFGYMENMNSNANPYRLTMEDRMRWAQISDVMKNNSMHQHPDQPYASRNSTLVDQSVYSNRCHASDDEITYFEPGMRPRSRMTRSHPVLSAPSCFEMDIPVHICNPYGGGGYPGTRRAKSHHSIPTAQY